MPIVLIIIGFNVTDYAITQTEKNEIAKILKMLKYFILFLYIYL